jgi:hypothetical protein
MGTSNSLVMTTSDILSLVGLRARTQPRAGNGLGYCTASAAFNYYAIDDRHQPTLPELTGSSAICHLPICHPPHLPYHIFVRLPDSPLAFGTRPHSHVLRPVNHPTVNPPPTAQMNLPQPTGQ